MTKLISSLPPLKPIQVTNLQTGEIDGDWVTNMSNLTKLVQEHTIRLISKNKAELVTLIAGTQKRFNPAEFARQNNIRVPLDLFPSELKAKSRVEKLIQHKVISEYAAFVLNPNPLKQEPVINQTINFGAVDKQMVTLSYAEGVLFLQAKIWDTEYEFEFQLPTYVLNRNIKKVSLPRVQQNKHGELVFHFTIEETPATRTPSKLKAGLDLGLKTPFVMVVTNENNKLVAQYKTSPRLTQLSDKKNRLQTEKKHLHNKAQAYQQLGLDSTILTAEVKRKLSKITRINFALAQQIGADVTKKLTKHNITILNVENLTWVSASKGTSRWSHSKQQDSITHSLARHGVKVKKINPRNTSQTCHKCGGTVTHNSNTRLAICVECKAKFDRDFNAAMNIARNINAYPFLRGATGVTVVEKQVTLPKGTSSVNIVQQNLINLTELQSSSVNY